jgi:hypothetical protein
MNVGATAFTVMLYFPHSRARHLVQVRNGSLCHAVHRFGR